MADFPFDDSVRGIQNGDDANLNDVTVDKIIFGNGTQQTTAASGGVSEGDNNNWTGTNTYNSHYPSSTLTSTPATDDFMTKRQTEALFMAKRFGSDTYYTTNTDILVNVGNPAATVPNGYNGLLPSLIAAITLDPSTQGSQIVLITCMINGEWHDRSFNKGIAIHRRQGNTDNTVYSTFLRPISGGGTNGLFTAPFMTQSWWNDNATTMESCCINMIDIIPANYPAATYQWRPILINSDQTDNETFHLNHTVYGGSTNRDEELAVSHISAVVLG